MPEFKTRRNNITKADIKQWEEELYVLPGKIQKLQTDIQSHQEKIKQLEPELKSIDDQIAPMDAKIEAMSARIEIIESTSKIKELESIIPPHQAVVDELSSQLAAVNKMLAPMNKEIWELERVIKAKETQAKIQALQSKIAQQDTIGATVVSSHTLAKVTLDTCNAEIQQLTSQMSSLESQNRSDESMIWSNDFRKILTPQPPPMPLAISQGQPMPVAVGQPEPVVCYDPNDTIRARIDLRKGEISQLQATLHIKRSAQSSYEQEVRRLKSEMDRYQSEIDALKRQLSSSEWDFSSFSSQEIAWCHREESSQLIVKLQQHKTLRAPHEQKNGLLSIEIGRHQSDISSLKKSISTLKERMDFLTTKVVDYAENNDMGDLNARLDHQRTLKKPLSVEKARLSNDIETEKNGINLAQSRIAECENILTRHKNNYFLINLRDHPQRAFDQLAKAMRAQLADYDDRFPTYQIYKVRAYLKDFEENILRIKNLTLPVKQVATDGQAFMLDNPHCLKYLMLCGSFWQMVDDIKTEDPHVANLMREALKTSKVDSSLCMEVYAPYCVMPLSESQLNIYEQKKYDETLKQFSATLDVLPIYEKKYKALRELGLKIIDKIQTRKTIDIDIKFATLILENSNNLALHPSDVDYQRKQQSLAHHVPEDKSASKKKCRGILLMFLGLAIAIGSGVACTVSPFAAIGVGVGAATFAAGYRLFRSGQKDLTHTMHTFERTAKEIKDSPPPYSAPNINVSAIPSAPVLEPDLVDKGAFSRLR